MKKKMQISLSASAQNNSEQRKINLNSKFFNQISIFT